MILNLLYNFWLAKSVLEIGFILSKIQLQVIVCDAKLAYPLSDMDFCELLDCELYQSGVSLIGVVLTK